MNIADASAFPIKIGELRSTNGGEGRVKGWRLHVLCCLRNPPASGWVEGGARSRPSFVGLSSFDGAIRGPCKQAELRALLKRSRSVEMTLTIPTLWLPNLG